jgi:hypothetical protein
MAMCTTGSGKVTGHEHDRLSGIAQGIAGGRVFRADDRADVASAKFFEFNALVGVHLEQASQPLFFSGARVNTWSPDFTVPEYTRTKVTGRHEGR